jgi:EmrB/QacA subfamily drug resistance transporter
VISGPAGADAIAPAPAGADDRTKRLTLLAAILASSVVFIDSTVVNVALPAIRDDLGAGLATQEWIVEAYLLALGSLILIGGSLSDVLGRRRVFRLGLLGFGTTSLLCAVAPNATLLVIARGLQGVAGALLVPSSLAVIVATFHESERGRAIGSWTAWAGVGTVVGPLAGGALVDIASWRWVFALGLLPVVITLVISERALPAHLDVGRARHVDVRGALLCVIGLAGPVLALIEQPARGWGDTLVAGSLAVGAAAVVAFLWWERHAPDPMLPLHLFSRRNFAAGNAATLAIYAGLGAMSFLVVIFLQQVAGYSAIDAGLSLIPITVLMFALSRRFGALADRFGPRLFMSLGPTIAGLGLFLMLRIDANPSYVSDVLAPVLVFGLGLSITVAPLTAAVLAGVEDEYAGIASGVNNAVARVAGLLAIAAVGALVSARFATTLDANLANVRLDRAQARAVTEAKTRPLAVPELRDVPAPRRAIVARAARDASVKAFHLGAGTTAFLLLAGGAISAAGIRNPRRRVSAADCPGGAILGASADAAREPSPAALEREPAGVGA